MHRIRIGDEPTYNQVPSFVSSHLNHVKPQGTVQPSSVSQQLIQYTGFGKVPYNSWPSLYRKLWTFASIFCFGLCLYQTVDRVIFYLSSPYATNIQVLRKKPMELPQITFCSGLLESNSSLAKNMLDGKILTNSSICRAMKKYPNIWNVSGSSHDVRRLWEDEYINGTMKYEVEFRSPDGKLCDGKSEYTRTVYGKCLTLSVAQLVKGDSGGSLWIRRDIDKRFDQDCFKVTRVLVHDNKHSAQHKPMVSQDFKMVDVQARLVISRKEFHYLNHPNNPCNDGHVRSECLLQCVHTNLSNEVNCSLPYMVNSALPACDSFLSAGSTYLKTRTVFKAVDLDDCKCVRSCFETFYHKNYYIDERNTTSFELTITVDNDVVEVIIETYIYSLISLLGDVGGNLGLYLGICVISLLDSLGSILASRGQKSRNRRLGKAVPKTGFYR